MSLHLNTATLTLLVQLPEHVFARHLPASPLVVGTALAEQVDRHILAERLGYYPALDYPKKNHFSHGNTRKTLKHSTFLARLFTTLRVTAVPAGSL